MPTDPLSGEWLDDLPTPPLGTRMPVPARPNGGGVPRAIAVLIGVGGLVAGAVVASAGWLLFGNDGSTAAVDPPARIGEFYRFAEVPGLRDGNRPRTVVDRQTRNDDESSARLSDSYNGAGAAVRQYANEELDEMFVLEVVRAQAESPPYVPFTDASDRSGGRPTEEVREFGEVACTIRTQPTSQLIVGFCVRTAGDLTVRITRITGNLGEQPDRVAELVNAAWSELS